MACPPRAFAPPVGPPGCADLVPAPAATLGTSHKELSGVAFLVVSWACGGTGGDGQGKDTSLVRLPPETGLLGAVDAADNAQH